MLPPEEDYTELDDYDDPYNDRYECGCCMCCGCDCDNQFWWEGDEEDDERNPD